MHSPSVAGMLPKRDWLEMTSEDFSQGNPACWIAVLPIAAVEQHGPHLSLGTDALVAETYLARARERMPSELPATFLPLQKIGTSEEHRAFPGTLTLSIETWLVRCAKSARAFTGRACASSSSSTATAAIPRSWGWSRAICACD